MPAAEFAHEAVKAMQRHGNPGIDSLGTELALIGLAGAGAGGFELTITSVDEGAATINGTIVGGSLTGVACMLQPLTDDVGSVVPVVGIGASYLCLGPGPFDERRMLVTDWTGSYVP